MNLIVKRKPGGLPHQGLFHFDGETVPCSLGRSGITTQKREGDGATPAGSFPLLFGYFRRDRMVRPHSLLELNEITPLDGWCDEPGHPAYNSAVSLPFSASHEKMMRDDRLYDVCLVLDYNISRCSRGMGSAIFFHLTNEEMGPTEGCVAINPDIMRRILPQLSSQSVMHVLTD